MKHTIRLFLVTAISVFLGIQVNAADGDRIGGIRAGYLNSRIYLDGEAIANTDPLNSFYVGFNRDNRLVPFLHLGTGLEYSQRGVVLSDDSKYELGYLAVPINLKLKLGPVFVLTGMAPGFKLSESGSLTGLPDEPEANVFDAPFFVGGGFKVLVFSIEARYHWGLLDINDAGNTSKYLEVGLGVSF